MEILLPIVLFIFGLVLGSAPVFIIMRSSGKLGIERAGIEGERELSVLSERLAGRERNLNELRNALESKEEKLAYLRDRLTKSKEHIAKLETHLKDWIKASREKLEFAEQVKTQAEDAFKVLSNEALKSNNQSFLQLAQEKLAKFSEISKGDLELRKQSIDEMVKPLGISLEKMTERIREIEKDRRGSYDILRTIINDLKNSQSDLVEQTGSLVSALKESSTHRGSWGEMQLKRVVEMAGMIEYCDFVQQESVATESGRLRPDMIVKLPDKKSIVVDSKASILAYVEALEAKTEKEKQAKLVRHCENIKKRMKELSEKRYWEQFDPSPEFVVMFIPGESFFSAALEVEPGLIELGVKNRVIMATPTTLIALLRAVAYGWKQETISVNARQVGRLGAELYGRMNKFAEYLQEIRSGIDASVKAYNRAVGNFESRVFVTARKLKELGASKGEEIPSLEIIEEGTRSPKPKLVAELPVPDDEK